MVRTLSIAAFVAMGAIAAAQDGGRVPDGAAGQESGVVVGCFLIRRLGDQER